MPAPKNRLKSTLAEGRMTLGLWLSFADPTAAEIAGAAGFDWCLIDAEHAPSSAFSTLAQIRALELGETPVVLRVPAGDPWLLKHALDLGVQTLLVPLVNSAAEARAIAHAVRYAPAGSRGMGAAQARASGYGAIPDYPVTANDEVCLIVQAETRAAIEALDDIARVDGVDAVFIGPSDLSADMGYPGQKDAPEVARAIEDGIGRIRAAGRAAGTLDFDTSRIPRYRDMGVTFLAIGGDIATYATGIRRLAAQARDAL